MSIPNYQPCTPELFTKTVAIHVSSKGQAHAVVQKLKSFDGLCDALLEGDDSILAILVGKSGQVSFCYTDFDRLDGITAPLVAGADFLSVPTDSLGVVIQRNVQRRKNEQRARDALYALSRLEVRNLSDDDLLRLEQIATQFGCSSRT